MHPSLYPYTGFCKLLLVSVLLIPVQGDLSRAKRQLQSSLMMNLESRLINFEDIGRLAVCIAV